MDDKQTSALDIANQYIESGKDQKSKQLQERLQAGIKRKREEREAKDQFMRKYRDEQRTGIIWAIVFLLCVGAFFSYIGFHILWLGVLWMFVSLLLDANKEERHVASQPTLKDMIAADNGEISYKEEQQELEYSAPSTRKTAIRKAAAFGAGYYAGKKTDL